MVSLIFGLLIRGMWEAINSFSEAVIYTVVYSSVYSAGVVFTVYSQLCVTSMLPCANNSIIILCGGVCIIK